MLGHEEETRESGHTGDTIESGALIVTRDRRYGRMRYKRDRRNRGDRRYRRGRRHNRDSIHR